MKVKVSVGVLLHFHGDKWIMKMCDGLIVRINFSLFSFTLSPCKWHFSKAQEMIVKQADADARRLMLNLTQAKTNWLKHEQSKRPVKRKSLNSMEINSQFCKVKPLRCLSVCLSVCLFVCLFVCLSVYWHMFGAKNFCKQSDLFKSQFKQRFNYEHHLTEYLLTG